MNNDDGSRKEKVLRAEIILRFTIIVLALLGVIAAIMSQALAFAPSLRSILWYCFPPALDFPFVGMPMYLLGCIIISLFLGIAVFMRMRGFIFKKTIIRDKYYIGELLKSKYNGEPAANRADLARKMYGDSEEYQRIPSIVKRMIDWNIESIKKFLNEESGDNVLVINSKWGSGKTTNLLIAISESRESNRYIYESAFKYNVGNNELFNDLLRALEEVLLELNIKVKPQINAIISNMSLDYKKTIFATLVNDAKYDLLSTDAIYGINCAYRRTKKANKVFVVIDDLDRLKGDDVAKVISLVSIMRRIEFIRIIIPADLSVINDSLGKANYANPSKFTEKYLPSKRSLRLKSNYEIAQNVSLEMLRKGKKKDVTGALAAVYLMLLSKEMERLTGGYSNYRHPWLGKADRDAEQNIDFVNEQIRQLLSIPRIVNERNEELSRYYQWDTKYNNIRQIENIIYALQTAPMRVSKNAENMRNNISIQEYEYAIKSWIFEYVERRWDIFGFSLRDLLDIIKTVETRKMPKDELRQFGYVYNQLFSNRIKIEQ